MGSGCGISLASPTPAGSPQALWRQHDNANSEPAPPTTTTAQEDATTAALSSAAAGQQHQHQLTQLHDSVLLKLFAQLDTRTKCALMCTCTHALRLIEKQEHWTELIFDTANEQHGLDPTVLFSLLKRSRGACQVIQLARCQEARAAQGQQRFSAGYKRDELLPHTIGLRALALAALCPNLRHLSMDERASCLGGMTDDMARALAVHCKQLSVLEVYFQRYSLPSEMFTDEGLIALTEGCRSLTRLTLHNCDRVSDRSMYAVAANCPALEAFTLGGYNEHVTDGGVTILLEACRRLHTVKLSSKLLKVTDASGSSLASHCPSLAVVKLTKAMTDSTLRQLATNCANLQEVDMHRCTRVSCEALQQLLQGCKQLHRLVLPLHLDMSALLKGSRRDFTLEEDEEQERQVLQFALPAAANNQQSQQQPQQQQ